MGWRTALVAAVEDPIIRRGQRTVDMVVKAIDKMLPEVPDKPLEQQTTRSFSRATSAARCSFRAGFSIVPMTGTTLSL